MVGRRRWTAYSHSIVPGGLEVTSYTTRLMLRTANKRHIAPKGRQGCQRRSGSSGEADKASKAARSAAAAAAAAAAARPAAIPSAPTHPPTLVADLGGDIAQEVGLRVCV